MSTTSTQNDLTSRLRSRLETDRKRIEETAARELKRLGESLSAVRSDALRSIEADTVEATGRMRAMLLRAWLRPLVVGLSLFLGFSGGSWVTMHWLSRSIEVRIEALATLNRQVEQARGTLAEIEGDRFVVLPFGTLDNPPWTVRGRPAVKLSRQ